MLGLGGVMQFGLTTFEVFQREPEMLHKWDASAKWNAHVQLKYWLSHR